MNPAKIRVTDFDLRYTIESGQPLTFFSDYDPKKNRLIYPTASHLLDIKFTGTSENGNLLVKGSSPAYAKRELTKRLRLNDDMKDIYSRISTDEFMANAIKKYYGMRLTINDPWETTLCFIISQYNNLKRIRGSTRKIVDLFGTEIKDDEGKVVGKRFPTSEQMMHITEKQLMECGTGFRARYIRNASEYCTNNLDLHKLQNKSYPKIKEELLEIAGVGDKVADCIALMGFGCLEAFPIDVWVKRTIERIYFKGKEKKIKDIHRFANERFQNLGGYAQQYIFWHGMHYE
ncbi:MAG: hypothetical protein KGH60_04885 [Candidatus Micrarchaeota archaeon]|nr:hypothetical protein [Candidatus Micrarchaeota archaeon]